MSTATLADHDIPIARVLPPRAPTLTQRILDVVAVLQLRAAENWDAGSDTEAWMAIGGVQALLGVLDVITREGS